MPTLSITPTGKIEFIHDDDMTEIVSGCGNTRIERASHVEPDTENPGTWFVSLLPVGGPIMTGFTRRSDALAAEVKWIEENRL